MTPSPTQQLNQRQQGPQPAQPQPMMPPPGQPMPPQQQPTAAGGNSFAPSQPAAPPAPVPAPMPAQPQSGASAQQMPVNQTTNPRPMPQQPIQARPQFSGVGGPGVSRPRPNAPMGIMPAPMGPMRPNRKPTPMGG